tara:strand:+ start:606 stop:851 length:246 start_codon:yes stop_codon:yes gene_type:complete
LLTFWGFFPIYEGYRNKQWRVIVVICRESSDPVLPKVFNGPIYGIGSFEINVKLDVWDHRSGDLAKYNDGYVGNGFMVQNS